MSCLTITDADIDSLEQDFGGELSFDEDRRNALKNHDDVQACPGSGKTTLVASKLILLANKWHEKYKGICVLTHTKTAKREIVERLQGHAFGHILLSYPHFVGTIQEFVDKFLALPLIRADYEFKRFSENDEAKIEVSRAKNNGFAMKDLCGKLYFPCAKAKYWEIENFVSSLHYINSELDLAFFTKNRILKSFRAANKSATYLLLQDLKERLNASGIFQYRDMYAFAERLLLENPATKFHLRNRFPIVFVDEMQDTQKFQDDILNDLFLCDEVIFQRFGDPDQAIFDGMNGEKPNESYNSQTGLVVIESSHRFGNDIAEKIRGFSYKQLSNLRSTKEQSENDVPHTIFLYDDRTIKQVLSEFGQIVFDSIRVNIETEEPQRKVIAKAIGSVGRENENGLTIKHYWAGYDKSKSPKSFKANKLIHIVKKCSEQREGNVVDNFNLLVRGILDFLRIADKKFTNQDGDDSYFSKTSLFRELQKNNKFDNFRSLLTNWLIAEFPARVTWNVQINILKSLLGLNSSINSNARNFIAYDSSLPPNSEAEEDQVVTNIYKCANGVAIEVATIHAVKGETHDATLIMETKYNRYFDLGDLLDYFIEEGKEMPPENHDHPTLETSLQAAFIKRLYVAASRPRYLLCLALHKNHVSDTQSGALIEKGWSICDLTELEEDETETNCT